MALLGAYQRFRGPLNVTFVCTIIWAVVNHGHRLLALAFRSGPLARVSLDFLPNNLTWQEHGKFLGLAVSTLVFLAMLWRYSRGSEARRKEEANADRAARAREAMQEQLRLEAARRAEAEKRQREALETAAQEAAASEAQTSAKQQQQQSQQKQPQPSHSTESEAARRARYAQLQQQADQAAAAAAAKKAAAAAAAAKLAQQQARQSVSVTATAVGTSSSQPNQHNSNGNGVSNSNSNGNVSSQTNASDAEAQQREWLQQLNARAAPSAAAPTPASVLQDRAVREEQDAEYFASLARDREAAAKRAAEKATEEEQRKAKVKRLQELAALKDQLRAELPPEPPATNTSDTDLAATGAAAAAGAAAAGAADGGKAGEAAVVTVRVRMPDGSTKTRRWRGQDNVRQVYNWVQSLEACPLWEPGEWHLAISYPRRIIANDKTLTVAEMAGKDTTIALMLERN